MRALTHQTIRPVPSTRKVSFSSHAQTPPLVKAAKHPLASHLKFDWMPIEQDDSSVPPKNRFRRYTPFQQWVMWLDDKYFMARIVGSSMLGRLPGEWAKRQAEQLAIFHPRKPSNKHRLRDPFLARQIEDVNIDNIDGMRGKRLHAWYLKGDPQKPLIVYAHGNCGNMNDREVVLEHIQDSGYPLLMYDHEGFGHSEGKPSEEGCYRSLEAVRQFVANSPLEGRVHKLDQQGAIGESLGSGIVVEEATKRPFKFKILAAAFNSIPGAFERLKKDMNPLVRLLMPNPDIIRQQFKSVDKIGQTTEPTFMLHGQHDPLVPIELADELITAAEGSSFRQAVMVVGGDHGNLFRVAGKRSMDLVDQFVQEVDRRSGKKDLRPR